MLKGSALLLVIMCAWAPGFGQPPTTSPAKAAPGVETRTDALLRSLQARDYWVWRRAAQELAPRCETHPAVAKAFVEGMAKSWLMLGMAGPVEALADAGDSAVPHMIAAIGARELDDMEAVSGPGMTFLVAIARMGPRARSAIPFLKQKLDDPKVHPYIRPAIRVVLACLGVRDEENIRLIARETVDDANGSGLCVLLGARANDWVTNEMIEGLIDHLEEGEGVGVLGVLGERARPALPAIWEELEDCRFSRGRAGLYFAMAAIDRPRRHAALREAFLHFEDACRFLTDSGIFNRAMYAESLMDAELTRATIVLVNDRHPVIAAEAIRMLQAIGLRAKEAVPVLIRTVRDPGLPDAVRVAAGVALGNIVDYSELARVKDLLGQQELPPVVRQSLRQAIRVMELRDPERPRTRKAQSAPTGGGRGSAKPVADPTPARTTTPAPTPTTAPAAATPIKPTGKKVTLDLGGGVTIVLVRISGGSFDMGAENTDIPALKVAARPVHRVTVPTFYMGPCEVTQQQWRAVMRTDPSWFSGNDRPVEQVSWVEARGFCAKLSSMTGYAIRLPSESEWEYACRAGTTTKYCSGNDESAFGDYAWYDDNSGDETHPVGQKTPNAWGMYDMHGNVNEWCEDFWHGDYKGAPTDGSAWTTGGDSAYRVMRGGDCYSFAWSCRSPNRHWSEPYTGIVSIGFRVAVDAP